MYKFDAAVAIERIAKVDDVRVGRSKTPAISFKLEFKDESFAWILL